MRYLLLLQIILFQLVNTGCQNVKNGLVQVSTYNSHQEGSVQGRVSLEELKRFGNMGAGAYPRADGFMLLINNDFYQIRENGSAAISPKSSQVSYAIIADFKPTIDYLTRKTYTLQQFQRAVNMRVSNENAFCFLYIRGHFRALTLHNRLSHQTSSSGNAEFRHISSIRRLDNVHGTFVGIRTPEYLSGISPPGYTFYFLNEARNAGGKVIDTFIINAHVRIDSEHDRFQLKLPPL